jgi:AcrR family transcriptional regulator
MSDRKRVDGPDGDEDAAFDASTPRNMHEYRSAESGRRMLEAAADLIVEVGYHKMTLAAIGERAGYSRGLATVRFGSKAALLQRLVEWSTAGWYDQRALSRTSDKNGYDSVLMLLDSISRRVAGDARKMRTFYSLMFQALGPHPNMRTYFVTFHRQLHSDFHAVIARGISDGSIDPRRDPDRDADFIIANLRGVAYLWALDPEQFNAVANFAHMVAVVASWLAPNRAPERRPRQRRRAQRAEGPPGALSTPPSGNLQTGIPVTSALNRA